MASTTQQLTFSFWNVFFSIVYLSSVLSTPLNSDGDSTIKEKPSFSDRFNQIKSYWLKEKCTFPNMRAFLPTPDKSGTAPEDFVLKACSTDDDNPDANVIEFHDQLCSTLFSTSKYLCNPSLNITQQQRIYLDTYSLDQLILDDHWDACTDVQEFPEKILDFLKGRACQFCVADHKLGPVCKLLIAVVKRYLDLVLPQKQTHRSGYVHGGDKDIKDPGTNSDSTKQGPDRPGQAGTGGALGDPVRSGEANSSGVVGGPVRQSETKPVDNKDTLKAPTDTKDTIPGPPVIGTGTRDQTESRQNPNELDTKIKTVESEQKKIDEQDNAKSQTPTDSQTGKQTVSETELIRDGSDGKLGRISLPFPNQVSNNNGDKGEHSDSVSGGTRPGTILHQPVLKETGMNRQSTSTATVLKPSILGSLGTGGSDIEGFSNTRGTSQNGDFDLGEKKDGLTAIGTPANRDSETKFNPIKDITSARQDIWANLKNKQTKPDSLIPLNINLGDTKASSSPKLPVDVQNADDHEDAQRDSDTDQTSNTKNQEAQAVGGAGNTGSVVHDNNVDPANKEKGGLVLDNNVDPANKEKGGLVLDNNVDPNKEKGGLVLDNNIDPNKAKNVLQPPSLDNIDDHNLPSLTNPVRDDLGIDDEADNIDNVGDNEDDDDIDNEGADEDTFDDDLEDSQQTWSNDNQKGVSRLRVAVDGVQQLPAKTGVDYEAEEPPSGHFMAYFITAVVLCVAGYVIYHNKQKLFAIAFEGRREGHRRRTGGGGGDGGSSAKYSKLQTSVEEVVPALEKSTTSKNYIY